MGASHPSTFPTKIYRHTLKVRDAGRAPCCLPVCGRACGRSGRGGRRRASLEGLVGGQEGLHGLGDRRRHQGVPHLRHEHAVC